MVEGVGRALRVHCAGGQCLFVVLHGSNVQIWGISLYVTCRFWLCDVQSSLLGHSSPLTCVLVKRLSVSSFLICSFLGFTRNCKYQSQDEAKTLGLGSHVE